MIRALRSITDGSGTHAAGTVLNYSHADEDRLVRLGAAEYANDSSLPVSDTSPDGGEGEGEIETISEEEYTEMLADLCRVNGIDVRLSETLFNDMDIQTIAELAEVIPEDLIKIKGIGKATAKSIIESAKEITENE